ncbi:TetR/AcrR family transcriptional regulator [Haloimpatiens sp. FM7330]|uniref:TetR/AcrR family transcriptional regulator n=1 Tax=Haloimpatiens sp. FM7330 TaxID=3298610 RepID=UPI00362E2920
MPHKNKGNPVSNKSKMWMENALLKLMQTENYDEITIQEITDNAGLSRRTFYRNYSSKDEIIEGYFYKIWCEYESLIRKQLDLTLPNVARIFFTVMKKHIDFLSLVNRHNLLPLFLSKVDKLLPQAFYEVKGKNMPFSKESIQYALTFSTGGFMCILIQWLNDSGQKSPKQMASIVKDIISMCNYSNPIKKQ